MLANSRSTVGEEVVAGRGVVEISAVERFYQEFPRVSNGFRGLNRLLVQFLRGKIFCDTTIVRVGELRAIVFTVK